MFVYSSQSVRYMFNVVLLLPTINEVCQTYIKVQDLVRGIRLLKNERCLMLVATKK